MEEDVTLLIDGTTINCFTSYSPKKIKIGQTYDVEITLNISENYEIQKVAPQKQLIESTDRTYAYFFYGELRNDSFYTFTLLNDEGVHYDHPDCNDHFIKLEVERVDVAFL
jgi:hypothetical protein